jgi:hypothetical protein
MNGGDFDMDRSQTLQKMREMLWSIANAPTARAGSPTVQRNALRLLLEIVGGVSFLITRETEELEELARRGIWQGPIVLRELAGLELARRRGAVPVRVLERRQRKISRELKTEVGPGGGLQWLRDDNHDRRN